jgi:hypothetical protein
MIAKGHKYTNKLLSFIPCVTDIGFCFVLGKYKMWHFLGFFVGPYFFDPIEISLEMPHKVFNPGKNH